MIRILVVNCSPRSKNNSSFLAERAIKGASAIKDIEIDTYDFANKQFNGCMASCMAHCMKNGTCCQKDDFNTFRDKYIAADGIIWVAPTYHVGPPAQTKAVIDRLCNCMFSYLKGSMPRFNKVCSIITQGSTRWGGQEYVEQFFLESFVLMKCIPVAGDMPKSYFGVAGYAPTWEYGSIKEDEVALECAEVIGMRTAEMAKVIQAGLEACRAELPKSYFFREVLEDRKNREEIIDMAWQKK